MRRVRRLGGCAGRPASGVSAHPIPNSSRDGRLPPGRTLHSLRVGQALERPLYVGTLSRYCAARLAARGSWRGGEGWVGLGSLGWVGLGWAVERGCCLPGCLPSLDSLASWAAGLLSCRLC